MGTVIILGVIVVVCVIAYTMKDKIAGHFSDPEYTRKHGLVMEKINSNYNEVLKEYVNDENTFAYMKEIIGEKDIKGLVCCKEQRSLSSAMTGAAKTAISGVVKVKEGISYYLVMGKDTLYNIEVDNESKSGKVLKSFKKSEIESIAIKKGNMMDNMKQAQKFKLSGGGMSGDGTDNSKLKKVILDLGKKKEEFFCYEHINEGEISTKKAMAWGNDLKTQTEKDILEGVLTYTIPEKTFEKLAQEYNGTIE